LCVGPAALFAPATRPSALVASDAYQRGEPINVIAPAATIATPLAIHQSELSLIPSTIGTAPHSGRINDTTGRKLQLIDS